LEKNPPMTKWFNLKPKNVVAVPPKKKYLNPEPIKIKPAMRAEFMFKIGPSSSLISFLAPKESIQLSLLCKDFFSRVLPAAQYVVVLKDEPKFEFIDFFGLSRNSNFEKMIKISLNVNIDNIEGSYYGEH
jgi:hypothetical protein